MQISTPRISHGYEFSAFIEQLCSSILRDYRYPLETYLRSILALVLQNQSAKALSYSLIAQIFWQAVTQPPMPFDDSWHAFSEPPTALLYGKDDSLPPLAVLRELLLYQISDLRLMAERGDLDFSAETPFLGLVSPTGNRWNNVQIHTFLQACTGAYADGADLSEAGWEDLAILLWMGQTHT